MLSKSNTLTCIACFGKIDGDLSSNASRSSDDERDGLVARHAGDE